MVSRVLARRALSLLALAASGYLCLATSPVPEDPPPPPLSVQLALPFDDVNSQRRVRVLVAGFEVRIILASPENITVSLEPGFTPSELRNCDYGGQRMLCLSNPTPEYGEFVLRFERTVGGTATVSVTGELYLGQAEVLSDLDQVMARGIDLELLP